MLIPVRCFTCGALIADRYEEFVKKVKEGEEPGKVLDKIGIKRYCCRRIFLSNVNIVDSILPYYEVLAERQAEYESEQF
ncbi:MAG: DNA-directed RNA polymerase subunit N [archaeon]|nr:DNA-directed RNA polymerase subunit N [archaeon]